MCILLKTETPGTWTEISASVMVTTFPAGDSQCSCLHLVLTSVLGDLITGGQLRHKIVYTWQEHAF